MKWQMTNDRGTFRDYLRDEDKRRDLIEFIRATFRDLATFADAMDTVLDQVCRYFSAEAALLVAWDDRQQVFRPFHASQRDDSVQVPLPPRDGRLAQMATDADQWRPVCLVAPGLLQQEFGGIATQSAVCAPVCLGGRVQAILCLIDINGLDEESSGLNGIVAEIANALCEETVRSLRDLGLSLDKRASGEYSLADLFHRGTKWVGVIFADIRGFTPLSETLSLRSGPMLDETGREFRLPDPARLLDDYCETMAEAACRHGRVDKFIGDAIMVIVGDLHEEERVGVTALKSICTATRLCDAFDNLRQQWEEGEDPDTPGWLELFRRRFSESADIELGIGVHFGPAIFGFYGSADHKGYTGVGDTVNTAKRLEERASKLGDLGEDCERILVSQTVSVRTEPYTPDARRHVLSIRGKAQPMPSYGIIAFNRDRCKAEGAQCADCPGSMWTA